jgi:hypothetical protein
MRTAGRPIMDGTPSPTSAVSRTWRFRAVASVRNLALAGGPRWGMFFRMGCARSRGRWRLGASSPSCPCPRSRPPFVGMVRRPNPLRMSSRAVARAPRTRNHFVLRLLYATLVAAAPLCFSGSIVQKAGWVVLQAVLTSTSPIHPGAPQDPRRLRSRRGRSPRCSRGTVPTNRAGSQGQQRRPGRRRSSRRGTG